MCHALRHTAVRCGLNSDLLGAEPYESLMSVTLYGQVAPKDQPVPDPPAQLGRVLTVMVVVVPE